MDNTYAEKAAPGAELEELRSLLKEAHYIMSPGPKAPMAPALPGQSLHERIARALKPRPLPLPYRMQNVDRPGETITDLQDGDGSIVATLYGEEGRATIEFIARACNAHGPLVDSLRHALKVGGMGIERGQAWQKLYEQATGEPLP